MYLFINHICMASNLTRRRSGQFTKISKNSKYIKRQGLVLMSHKTRSWHLCPEGIPQIDPIGLQKELGVVPEDLMHTWYERVKLALFSTLPQ